MATPNKRQRRQAPKNTSNFKGGGVIVGRLAIQQTRKFNSLRNNSSSKLDGPKSWTGQGRPKRGCSLNSKRDRKVKLVAGGRGFSATKFSTLAGTCHECEHEATWPKKARTIGKKGVIF